MKRKSKDADAVAPAPPVPEREYTFYGDWCSGQPNLQRAYEQQQAAKAAAAQAMRPRVKVIDRGPQPSNYDPVVNGLWRRYIEAYEFPEPAKPAPAVDAYGPGTSSKWRDYVGEGGEIPLEAAQPVRSHRVGEAHGRQGRSRDERADRLRTRVPARRGIAFETCA